jgi:hypothetical protein
LKESRYEELYDDGDGCDEFFYLWNGDNPNQQPDCTIYDCDGDDDGVSDIVGAEGRTWVDYSDVVDSVQYPDACVQSGCGTQELACWIAEDSTVVIDLGDNGVCIPGDSGTRAGIKDEVDSRIGQSVSVPLYDDTGCDGRSCPGGTTYHVTRFACVEVVGWDQSLELPRIDGGIPPWKGKVIAVKVSCGGCDTSSGCTVGGPIPPWGVRAVSLVR